MNMNSKMLAGALLGVLALAQSPSTAASDIKAYHGSGCKVYGTTPWTALGFGWQGLFNASDTPKLVVCPLIKDSENNWDGDAITPTNNATVDVHWRSPAMGGGISCTAYVTRNNGLTSSQSFTDYADTATNRNNDIINLVSGGTPNDLGSIMICNVGSKVVLQHYRLIEQGVTDL